MKQASLKEILKSQMTEPFTKSDLQFVDTHFERLKKHSCYVTYDSKYLDKNMSEGFLIFELSQINLRLLYVKVFGGKGFFGKKIHYSIYLQEFDEKDWAHISIQKTLTIAITSIGNLFRQEGLLKGAAI